MFTPRFFDRCLSSVVKYLVCFSCPVLPPCDGPGPYIRLPCLPTSKPTSLALQNIFHDFTIIHLAWIFIMYICPTLHST